MYTLLPAGRRLPRMLLTLIFAWAAPGSAWAQAGEPYGAWSLAVGLGSTQYETSRTGIAREFPQLQSDFRVDESAVGFRLLGSYRFDPWLALDLELIELGDVVAADANGRRKLFSVAGLVTALRAQYPLGDRLAAFGRVGAFIWSSSVGFDDTVDDGLDLALGAGADINLWGGFERVLRVEWQRFGFNGVTLDSADSLSLNLVFNF